MQNESNRESKIANVIENMGKRDNIFIIRETESEAEAIRHSSVKELIDSLSSKKTGKYRIFPNGNIALDILKREEDMIDFMKAQVVNLSSRNHSLMSFCTAKQILLTEI